MTIITSFNGEYRFLSNFWPARLEIGDDPIIFPTVEHAFVAAKVCLNAPDRRQQQMAIARILSPGSAKQAGRRLKLRADWMRARLPIMKALVRLKFSAHKVLGDALVDTGDAQLMEGNRWGDTFWGVCDGAGQNHLGIILMNERARLAEKERLYEAA